MPQSYDIFISYAHVNNEPHSYETEGWIDCFVTDLRVELNQLFGRKENYNIWKDEERLRGNHNLTEEIRKTLSQSKILFVFYSKAYQESDWCQQELSYFIKQYGIDSNRIFFVLQDECKPTETHKNHLNYPFYHTAKNTSNYRLQASAENNTYQQRIKDIAFDLYQELCRLSLETCSLAQNPSKTIYLAQVSENYLEYREQLVRELKQHHYHVIPESHILTIDQHLQQKIEQSICFVQLLEEDNNMGLPVQLYESAIQANKKILQWRPQELGPNKINTIENKRHQQLLLDKTVIANSLCNFQQTLLEFLKPSQKTSKPKNSSKQTIFINTDHGTEDYTIAKNIFNQLSKQKQYTCLLPLEDKHARPEEIREDLEENLRLCDIVLLIYKQTQITQIRRLLRECVRINQDRETPFKTAICATNDQQAALNMALPNLYELKCNHDFDQHCFDSLLNEVLS